MFLINTLHRTNVNLFTEQDIIANISNDVGQITCFLFPVPFFLWLLARGYLYHTTWE